MRWTCTPSSRTSSACGWADDRHGDPEWVAIHRKHHAKCETAEDPHSPMVYGHWGVLRFGVDLYRKEAKNAETISRYGYGTPDDWMERNVHGCKYTGRAWAFR